MLSALRPLYHHINLSIHWFIVLFCQFYSMKQVQRFSEGLSKRTIDWTSNWDRIYPFFGLNIFNDVKIDTQFASFFSSLSFILRFFSSAQSMRTFSLIQRRVSLKFTSNSFHKVIQVNLPLLFFEYLMKTM